MTMQPPIEYAALAPRRPGILTGVGVASIVIGAISILVCLSTIMSSAIFMFMPQMPMPTAVPSPSVPSPTMTPPATSQPANATGGNVSFFYSTSSYSTRSNQVPGGFPFHVDQGAALLMGGESLLSLALSVLLIVAGALMFRNSPKTGRFHWIYVACKPPLAVLSGFAMYFFYASMMTSMSSGFANMPGGANFNGMMRVIPLIEAMFMAVIALIYPITLLFILSTRKNREYLRQL